MSPAPQTVANDERCYGMTWNLVHKMFKNDKFKLWPYIPIIGGVAFSTATILLGRRNLKAMLATQGIIGVATIAMANSVATSAIIKERSMST